MSVLKRPEMTDMTNICTLPGLNQKGECTIYSLISQLLTLYSAS